MKTLRDNWAILTGLATLCFFAGAAYFRLGGVESKVADINDKLTKIYVTRSEVQALDARVQRLEYHEDHNASTRK